MDPATLIRHALAAPKKPLTLKEALSSVADFRIDRSVFGGISVKRKELTWDDDKLLKLMLAA